MMPNLQFITNHANRITSLLSLNNHITHLNTISTLSVLNTMNLILIHTHCPTLPNHISYNILTMSLKSSHLNILISFVTLSLFFLSMCLTNTKVKTLQVKNQKPFNNTWRYICFQIRVSWDNKLHVVSTGVCTWGFSNFQALSL